MDLSDLPEELVDMIAVYLNYEDLIACSKVNSHWRQAFNINSVWKRFCTYHANYFDYQKSQMNFSQDSGSSGLCKEKEKLSKELFAKRNLVKHKFHITEFEFGSEYFDNVVDAVDEVGKHWLFISCLEGPFDDREHKLKGWTIDEGTKSHFCIKTPLRNVTGLHDSEMKIKRDKFYYICKSAVLLYEFANPLYTMKLLHKINIRLFDWCVNGLLLDKAMVFTDSVIVGFGYTSFHVPKFEPIFNVWDEKGSLIREEYSCVMNPDMLQDMPATSTPILNVKANSTDKIVLVYQHFKSEFNSLCFCVKTFDATILKYTDFFIQKNKQIISFDICGNIVSILYSKTKRMVSVKCYTVQDSREAVFKININTTRYDAFHQLIPGCGNGELFVLGNNTVFLFDISLKKEINRFNVIGKYISVTLLKNDIMLLRYFYKKLVFHEIFNYKSNQKLNLFSPQPYSAENCYDFSFIRGYHSPPKLIAFTDPLLAYPCEIEHSKITIVSFW